jgi:anti-sigma-K factor RskA
VKDDHHTKDEKQADAALYALGALSQIEARTFENARRSDSEIDQETAEFETLIGFLGLTAEEAEPSPYIRDLILNRFEKEQQAKPRKVELVQPEPVRPFTPAPVVEEQTSRSRSFIPWAVAASFAIIALGAVFFWNRSYQDATRLQQQLALAESEKRRLVAQVEQQGHNQEDIQGIQATISSPDLKLIELGGQEVAPQSSARVLWDVNNRRWAVVVNLPPAPPGKVYQLWFVTKDAKRSAGLLKTDRAGHGITLVTVPSDLNQFDATAITLEPEGGSTQPTSQIYALGKSSI